jgi:hypothetical protein
MRYYPDAALKLSVQLFANMAQRRKTWRIRAKYRDGCVDQRPRLRLSHSVVFFIGGEPRCRFPWSIQGAKESIAYMYITSQMNASPPKYK